MCTTKFPIKISSLVVIVIAVLSLVACKGGNKTADADRLAADSLNKELLASDIKEVLYPLPTPFEMTKMLNDIGAKYTAKNLNSTANIEKYYTEQNKAVNLGIYGADLAYASTYQQQQDIQTYMGAIKTLADQLGVTYDYTMLLSDEYKDKLNNKDSLANIVTNTIYDTYQYLDQKSNPDLAVNMITGMWVELMYIATNISEDSYNFTGMVDIISKQKASYDKVMDLLASRNTNPDIKNLETKLQALKPAFDKVDTGLSETDYNLILQTIRSVRGSVI
ncbi:MAG TPA: hypothetical protein VJ203_13430 [Bacteroidales bacterium]|nr:hypothetical protein [Bacteroidales bacterium]